MQDSEHLQTVLPLLLYHKTTLLCYNQLNTLQLKQHHANPMNAPRIGWARDTHISQQDEAVPGFRKVVPSQEQCSAVFPSKARGVHEDCVVLPNYLHVETAEHCSWLGTGINEQECALDGIAQP